MISGIRGKDTAPELRVRRFVHRAGLRFRLHVRDLPGRPDLVLPKHRSVVFVHGCFWHQHDGCVKAVMPSSNREFWQAKLEGNRARDIRHRAELERLGWTVHVIWECELNTEAALATLVASVRRPDVDQ
jgi:DNA mismatch endonuclease, patch repair protein